jgi:hypothetical protein
MDSCLQNKHAFHKTAQYNPFPLATPNTTPSVQTGPERLWPRLTHTPPLRRTARLTLAPPPPQELTGPEQHVSPWSHPLTVQTGPKQPISPWPRPLTVQTGPKQPSHLGHAQHTHPSQELTVQTGPEQPVSLWPCLHWHPPQLCRETHRLSKYAHVGGGSCMVPLLAQ